ncbi:winged helix-turn-helix domain-containing protein [Brachyspira pilosicoli]|uniref:winged helix-turn-helix domain-containing protein n=1 Tax=Brachyspira pilosicoli TaxID=52584 RepID=UPI003006BC7E
MALLKYRDYDKYVLKCLYNATEPININYIFNIVKDYTNTSDEDFNLLHKNGNYKFKDRVHWSLFYLKKQNF